MQAAHPGVGESSALPGASDLSEAAALHELRAQLSQARSELADLAEKYEETRSSTAYQIGLRIARSPLGAMYRLFARWRSHDSRPLARSVSTDQGAAGASPYPTTAFEQQLQSLPAGEPVAVAHPDWLGIRSSAMQMFDHLLFISDDLTPAIAKTLASRLLERQPSAIVFQGFPFSYRYLVEALQNEASHIPLYVVWHGTFMQATEDYAWRSFRLVCALQKQGKIRRVGCVKQGQDEILRRNGVNAGFLLNAYRQVPEQASSVAVQPVRLGIWSISELKHKPPYEMLAAASMIDGALVMGSVASPRMLEFCDEFRIAHDFVGSMVPQLDMPRHLAACHVNLYVTLNECAPMLPLESFAVGVPCVMGPNTPYFSDDAYLQEKLVVRVPDDAREIADRIEDTLLARDEIIAAYREYAMRHNARSANTIRQFLS